MERGRNAERNEGRQNFVMIPNPVESSSNVGAGKGLKPLVAMSIYPNLV
jgi:hypothetical protein